MKKILSSYYLVAIYFTFAKRLKFELFKMFIGKLVMPISKKEYRNSILNFLNKLVHILFLSKTKSSKLYKIKGFFSKSN